MEFIVSTIICTFPCHPRIMNNKKNDLLRLVAYEDMMYPRRRRFTRQGTPPKGKSSSFRELSEIRDYNKKMEELYGIMDEL
jgi:hypothetical protein